MAGEGEVRAMVRRRSEAESGDRLVSGSTWLSDRGGALDHPVMAIERLRDVRRSENWNSDPRPTSPVRPDAPGLSVDERSALYLLSMAHALLKRDHPAVAAMIDYAMLDIAVGQPD